MDEGKATGPRPRRWGRPRPAGDPPSPANPAGPAGPPQPSSAGPGPTPAEGSPGPATAASPPEASVGGSPAQPLHGEDPYGTPPYGGPGPWAPAPPVQRPGATPAEGTVPPPHAVLPGTPAHGTVVPGTPAHGTPTHGTPTHGAVPYGGTPAHGTVVPGTPAHGTPTHGTPTHGAAPHGAPLGPEQAQLPAGAPQGGSPPGPGAGQWQSYDPWAAASRAAVAGHTPVRAADRRPRGVVLLVAAVLLALVSGGIGGAIGSYVERNGGLNDIELPQADAEGGERDPGSIAGISEATLPGVVTLHVQGGSAQGTGTGFVLDDRGHILTNNHVVAPAAQGGTIRVTFHGGTRVPAEIVGMDSSYDLAVVKVTGVSGLRPLPLGNSDSVRVGDPVVAIGAPFELDGTVTAGIISATERPITAGGDDGTDISYVNALQTDAPINPGNSGGPLVDAKGRVIGINSAIRGGDSSGEPGGTRGSVGLGFAIPINQGKRVAEELINTGRATHPVIGVRLDTAYAGEGARVAEDGEAGPAVEPGGPGDKAGIQKGDVITAVDGDRVRSPEELIVTIRSGKPGDELRLTVERGGTERSITLTLGSSSGD